MSLQPEDWERLLTDRLDRPVRVSYGRSRTRPASGSFGPGGLKLRLHRFFESAPPDVQEALAAWLKTGRRARRASALLDRWIDEQLAALPEPARRRTAVRLQGRVHDLQPLVRALLTAELAGDFQEEEPPTVTWGRRGRAPRRSLQLGSYSPHHHLVRIHPVLDQAFVPDWFVKSVLHHELLHAALVEVRPDGRRHAGHGPEFRARERAHPDYPRSERWQRENLAALMRSARREVEVGGADAAQPGLPFGGI